MGTGTTGTGTGAAAAAAAALNNPFLPHKNPTSGRWAPPKYSLRRQAQLVKHARVSGTLHLLPPGPKMSATQLLAAAATATPTPTPTPTSTSTAPAPASASSADVGDRVELEEGKEVERGLVSVRLRQRQEGAQVQEEAEADGPVTSAAAAWRRQVEWVGTVRERNVAGSDVGNRLYAGKKRMFKGHKWERVRERRVARTRMLLRDMDKRVQRFKQVRFGLV
jgi:large subunit ribosomal protein L25